MVARIQINNFLWKERPAAGGEQPAKSRFIAKVLLLVLSLQVTQYFSSSHHKLTNKWSGSRSQFANAFIIGMRIY